MQRTHRGWTHGWVSVPYISYLAIFSVYFYIHPLSHYFQVLNVPFVIQKEKTWSNSDRIGIKI